MAGHIEKRGDNTWRVTVFLGTDPVTGKDERHRKTIHGTKKDAQKYLTGYLRDRDLGRYAAPEEMPLNAFLDKWLAVQETRLKTRTFTEYREILDRHVRPLLGAIPIQKLKPMAIQDLYATLGKSATKTPKGNLRRMGAAGIRKVHAVLRAALGAAVEWRVLEHNPAQYAKPPKLVAKERPTVTDERAAAFVAVALRSPRGLVFLVAIASGMRPQEYLALQWTDLDWNTGRLTVNRVLTRIRGGGWIFEECKTQKSRRSIVLPPDLLPLLREHRTKQVERRLLLGPSWQDHNLMFTTDEGAPLHAMNLATRDFRRILAEAELPTDLRPYDLRHSCATILLQQGKILKLIADQLGHATIRLTADTYSHVQPGMLQEAADAMNTVLFGGTSTTPKG